MSEAGLEHSQHKCGHEEVDAIHKEEWEKQHAFIKAYKEVLQNVVGNKGAWWIEAKEVLTRISEMEKGEELPGFMEYLKKKRK